MTNKTLATLVAAAAVVAASCGTSKVQDITGPVPTARIRFFNFGVNAPSVNFYAGSAKVTATVSTTGTEATTGVSYGGVGAGGNYSAVDPGAYDLTGKIAAATDKDLVVTKVSTSLADGKAYSMYVSGFYDATGKTVEAFVVEDAIPPAIDWGNATVRFVNAISNSQPMTLYAKNSSTGTETAVGGLVAYKGAGAFATLPAGIYDLGTRVAGSSANAVTLTAASLLAGRVYTVGARGDITVTSATATTRPILTSTANR